MANSGTGEDPLELERIAVSETNTLLGRGQGRWSVEDLLG